MSLTLTYDEIRRELGRFLGIGTDFNSWSAATATEIADIIRRGSRRFYFPEPIAISDNEVVTHKWSFLEAELSVTLAAGATYHDLPTDFLSLSRRPSIIGSDYPLAEIAENSLRDLTNAEAGLGFPQYYTVQRNAVGGALAYRIGVHPKPASSMTLEGNYVFEPPEVGPGQAPICTANHSETFLSALLATADEMLNIESIGQQSYHGERFKTLMRMSILQDRAIGGSDG